MQVDCEYTVIIPTLNAAGSIERQIRCLVEQTMPPKRILVVDSQSEDDTVRLARSFDLVDVVMVQRKDFDHGTTRDLAVKATNTPFVVLITQDALPANGQCMEMLIRPMVGDEKVAAVCARQVAYTDASARERLIRAFRYPEISARWTMDGVELLGIRAYQLSDACSAYRRAAYDAVGGFRHGVGTNEDMLIAATFLIEGYALAYQADALVWHSHNLTWFEEYRRNAKIGFFLTQYRAYFSNAGDTGEGLKMLHSVMKELLKQGYWNEIAPFVLNCAARFLGNKAGKMRGRYMRKGRSAMKRDISQ